MSLVKVSGNASGTGTLTIAAPNTNSDYTLTLPQATTTLVGTDATQTLTNKTIQGGAITSGTAVASTSGTSIDFTSIPSWVKRITVMFNGVSGSGTSQPLIRLGVSGTPETTGYTSMASMVTTTNDVTRGASATSGFAYNYQGFSSSVYSGSVTLSYFGSNIWACSGSVVDIANLANSTVSGVKSLAGVLNMIRITTVNGTDTFDAGSINILYEG